MTISGDAMTKHARRAFLFLVVLGAISIGIIGWLISKQNDKLAQRSQEACLMQSEARMESNQQIRVPLRSTDRLLASLLRQAAATQDRLGHPVEARRARELAARFDGFAAAIAVLVPPKCDFTKP